MGQYHRIYNIDKKETFLLGGSKLVEQASNYANMAGLMILLCNSNGRGGGDFHVAADRYTKTGKAIFKSQKKKALQAAIDKISGRWAGDRIVVQGDYAEDSDRAFIPKSDLGDYTSITELVVAALESDTDARKIIESEREFARKF